MKEIYGKDAKNTTLTVAPSTQILASTTNWDKFHEPPRKQSLVEL